MANKPIAMKKLKSVLRLYTEGKSKAFISKYQSLSRNTVKKYLKQFTSSKLTYEQVEKMSDSELYKLFQHPEANQVPIRLEQLRGFFPYMHKELKRTGVNREILWEEYIKKHLDGYGKTQFNEHYNRWNHRVNPVMHINHKAGDKLYVDYAGKHLHIVDKESGEIKEVEVFVAVLGASQLTYVEASESQKKEDFITSVENALRYYGGVPSAIVPDNLKSAVTKSHRYEPTLNETFSDFADYYGTTILPARAYHPRDKALVEGAVRIIYSRIYAQLRGEQFFSLKSLNTAIGETLEGFNNRKMNARPYSRRQLFDEVEKNELQPLPTERYEMKETSWATVMQNGHVCLQKDKHYYSVPYRFLKKKVKLVWSSKEVSIYHNYERIAFHKRVKNAYNYTTVEDHMASAHKFITQWNPQYFIDWGGGIDEDVQQLIREILEKKQHPEQAYRSCIGILGLAKKVGKDRLIKACTRALEYGVYNYKIVQNILEKGLDQMEDEQQPEVPLPTHDNIRGKQYYTNPLNIKNHEQSNT